MNSVAKVFLLCIVLAAAFAIRSEYIREDGIYLLGADPYYHYRMAETILTQGKRPEWDVMASWPTGQPVTYPPIFQYYLAYSFKTIGGPKDLLFSLVITLLFVLTVKVEKMKNLPVTAFLCGFFLFLFSQMWPGYWYMLPLLTASFLVWILHKREVYCIESLIAFLVGFCSFIALCGGAYLVGVLLLAVFSFYEGFTHVVAVQPNCIYM